jgi:RsiW-degrading membrane proteinase PrsW (M82 family)
MDLLLWITVGFIVIGLVVLLSMKKSMERKVALIIENEESMESKQISNKPVIWWIVGATVWGLVSMLLVVRSISVFM